MRARRCNSFYARVKTRGVSGVARAAGVSDLHISPERRGPSFSSQRILILYFPPAARPNASSGQDLPTRSFGSIISPPFPSIVTAPLGAVMLIVSYLSLLAISYRQQYGEALGISRGPRRIE